MKKSIIIMLCLSVGIQLSFLDPVNDKKKKNKSEKERVSTKENRSFHSVKKWSVTIEFSNGDKIKKIIEECEDPKLSIMETAFNKGEWYVNHIKGVKGYSVKPVSNNDYVLLAVD